MSVEEHKLRILYSKLLRKIFGSKWEKVTRDWRKLHNEELHGLNKSPNFVLVIKSRRIRWVGMWHVWGEKRNA
jgi:hypothetical protein